MGIDFNKFSGNYFKLEQDKRTIVKMANWKEAVTTFENKEKEGIYFDILEENGAPVKKEWTITSLQLIQKLRPHIEEAEKKSHNAITVAIIKIGDKKDTKYSVEFLGSGASSAPSSHPTINSAGSENPAQDATIATWQNMVVAGAMTKEAFDKAIAEMKEKEK